LNRVSENDKKSEVPQKTFRQDEKLTMHNIYRKLTGGSLTKAKDQKLEVPRSVRRLTTNPAQKTGQDEKKIERK